PSVVNTATTNDNTTSASSAINLPASIVAGNLLLMVISQAANTGTAITQPTGWSTLVSNNAAGRLMAIFYKTATGSEGAMVTVSHSALRTTAVAYQISGWSGTPEITAAATGSSSNPDSGSISPSWGGAANLYLSVYGSGLSATISSVPASYSNGVSVT